jgi:hypothetical protein
MNFKSIYFQFLHIKMAHIIHILNQRFNLYNTTLLKINKKPDNYKKSDNSQKNGQLRKKHGISDKKIDFIQL